MMPKVFRLPDLKLDIHEESAPSHLESFPPDRTNFQSINLGGFSLVGQRQPQTHHLLAIRTLRLLRLLPCSDYPRLTHPSTPPPPDGRYSLCERGTLPSCRIVFHFYSPIRRMGNRQHWISKLFPDLHQFSIDFALTKGLGAMCAKWSGTA
ncbi:hypothetical protein AVEN_190544-1 [Araneus ventricosus]|uniref:Uncharacterized protein n=1 Tax=Araneus ventricosus TaxID=182803 RepID=A0A4Y2CDQ7_ARAVE|nr:hypothetical protein AVEN_190544-1 [Araneus ventricosus]